MAEAATLSVFGLTPNSALSAMYALTMSGWAGSSETPLYSAHSRQLRHWLSYTLRVLSASPNRSAFRRRR